MLPTSPLISWPHGWPLLVLVCLTASSGKASAAPAKELPPLQAPEVLLESAKDPLVRESAAQVLGLRGEPGQVPLLSRALAKDDNRWVRMRAAEALGLIGSAAAAGPLDSALSREKDQRVRRAIGMALLRLGKQRGVDELMWQLKSGTNHTKAEVMQLLVAFSGQPLGQDVNAWWRYFYGAGRAFVGSRPGGSPALLPLRGSEGLDGGPRQGPYLSASALQPGWQLLPAVVINLPPSRQPVGAGQLQRYAAQAKALPDRCLILLNTNWQRQGAPMQPAPASGKRPPAASDRSQGGGPGLLPEALEYLLRRAPNLLGVGIDAPTLDSAQATGGPVRQRLIEAKRLVLEGLGDLELLHPHGSRLVLLVPGGAGAPQRQQVQLLAVLP